jgi:hypothetical protein
MYLIRGMAIVGNIGKGLCALLCILYIQGCDIKKNKQADPAEQFVKIYDDQAFADTYQPVAITQAGDGGFIILAKSRIAASTFFGIYILKTDKYGSFVSEKQLDNTLVNPVRTLMKVGSYYYFFCMNSISLETKLMQVDETGNVAEIIQLAGAIYPLCASFDESTKQFILLHYNRDNKTSTLLTITTTGSVTNKREFITGFNDFDVEKPIIEHLTGTGKNLPFFTGSLNNGTYFFNGFNNYTLSMVLFRFDSSKPAILNGYGTERCMSAAAYISDAKFAAARFAYGQNFVTPNALINYSPGTVASSKDLGGYTMLEWQTDAPVILKRLTVAGKNIILYGSNNNAGQICLYAYDEASGALIGTKHLGYANAFQLGDFIVTQDNGLAVAGTSYLSNRFARICIFKLSASELEEFTK